ncbi:myosin heavy chain kinase D [Periplaneta americana]|uniref:Uncharacterized protein n=1 Tax=Periplaneta americana TaxID=6978 RepID=A0ABQ8SHY8_PERAM|nr:hypothetical protein ANN_15978 [Periplaneta americana]
MPLSVTATVSNQDKHLGEIYALLFHNDKIYSAAVDGKIKIWNTDLKLETQFQAHESAIYHIAALKDTLYSCSNDGTIQAWSLDTYKHKKTLIKYTEEEVLRLYIVDGKLYAGNDKGILTIWENDAMINQYNLVEEIRDFGVDGAFIYAVRDRDMCVHELLPGDKNKYTTRIALEGSSPLRLVGNKLCFAARSGNNICVHENSKKSGFKELGVIQAHEMILNAMCGYEDSTLFSAGYDGKLKQWNLDTLQNVGTCEIGYCVNTICVGLQGQIYVAGDNGNLNRVDNK